MGEELGQSLLSLGGGIAGSPGMHFSLPQGHVHQCRAGESCLSAIFGVLDTDLQLGDMERSSSIHSSNKYSSRALRTPGAHKASLPIKYL